MMKWVVKVAVRHPERRLPSYRDWESRTQGRGIRLHGGQNGAGLAAGSDRGRAGAAGD